MITFKSSVRLHRLTPALKVILDHLWAVDTGGVGFVWGDQEWPLPADLVVTSINDGPHMKGSRHYTDEALDLRTHNFASRSTRRAFRAYFADRIGPRFTVLLENEGTPDEHIHIQPKKGTTYP